MFESPHRDDLARGVLRDLVAKPDRGGGDHLPQSNAHIDWHFHTASTRANLLVVLSIVHRIQETL